MKAFMTTLNAMEKQPLEVGLIKPSRKVVDQYFKTSSGKGDQGEKDLLGPWNGDASIERVDAPALQNFVDLQLGTRQAKPIDGPELSFSDQEAAQLKPLDHVGEEPKRKGAHKAARASRHV